MKGVAHQMNESSGHSYESNKSKNVCWNCDLTNHIFTDCKVKRKTFCYKCDLKNVKSIDCSKCSKH